MNPATNRRRKRNRIGRGLTFEKVWATIERNAEEAKQRVAEWEAERKKEAEERKKAAEEWEAKLQKEAEERKKEAEERKKEFERSHKELEQAQKETARVVKDVGEQMGGLHRSFGQMAEHLVAPGIVDKFNDLGFHITQAAENGVKILDDKKNIRAEIDLLMWNRNYIIAIEVKAKLGKQDIEKHLRRLEILREDINKTGDCRKIRGGMAVAILGEGDKEAILNAGFYLLVQSGDTMKIDLPDNFVPREW